MIKNFIENAKLTAQKVMTKDIRVLETFPPFESLAIKNYQVPKDNIWQYSLEELYLLIQQMEEYVNRVQKSYHDVSEQFTPILSKFSMLEKERKRMSTELLEKEDYAKQLEQAMVEMQADVDSELRKKETMQCELEQAKKEISVLQSQAQWNNQIEDHEVHEFDQALLELDKSQDEQYKQRIDTLTLELVEQIQLNKDNITKIQQLQEDIEKKAYENRTLNRNINMVLQQIADIQTKNRMELEQKNHTVNSLMEQHRQLINQMDELTRQSQVSLQIQIDNSKMKEKITELQQQLINKSEQISNLECQYRDVMQQKSQLDELIQVYKHKRDIAITEIQQLSQKQVIGENSYTISVQKLKQIRYNIQSKLIHTRKEFEQIYKQYLMLICQLENTEQSEQLMKLEGNINKLIENMQNLVDEIEDLMQ